MPGTYAQLAELTKVSPTETATVGLSDAPKTAETVGSGATPITRKNRPVKSPTAALADPVAMGEATPTVTQGRDKSREISSETPREKSRGLPDREEIQEFSFRLRDELKLKVKVQAEVPYQPLYPWRIPGEGKAEEGYLTRSGKRLCKNCLR